MPPAELLNLLSRIQPEDVVREPFPHVVVRHPLPTDVALALTNEFPPDDLMIEASPGSPRGSNKRFNIYARDVESNAHIPAIWKQFIQEQTSARFFSHAMRVFGPWVREYYPDLVREWGANFEQARVATRSVDTRVDANIQLDAGISINTPVSTIPTSVRMAHLDLPTKLFTGLYYLRPLLDGDTRGGDLVLCRHRRGAPTRRFWKYEVDPSHVDEVLTIPYENNVFVMFLNSFDSVHAVTPRARTLHTRKFVNLVVEVDRPLFDTGAHQMPWFPYRPVYYGRQLLSWFRL
jgi:hypothetical protein